MKIIRMDPNPSRAYPSPQNWSGPEVPEGYAAIPEDMDLKSFYDHNGFVVLAIEQVLGVDTVAFYAPNTEAWEAWKASQPPEPEPEPTPQEDTDALLVDHEYRLTLLELGVAEGV